MKMKLKRKYGSLAAFRNAGKGLAFILPSFAGVCVFWLIPYVDVIRRFFCGAVNGEFAGLENYRTIFANKAFRLAAGNTLRFFGVCAAVGNAFPDRSSIAYRTKKVCTGAEEFLSSAHGDSCSVSSPFVETAV